MPDKYTVQDVFDTALHGKPIEFEAAVNDVLTGKAADLVDVIRQQVRADLFQDAEVNDDPDLPEEDEDADGDTPEEQDPADEVDAAESAEDEENED